MWSVQCKSSASIACNDAFSARTQRLINRSRRLICRRHAGKCFAVVEDRDGRGDLTASHL